MMQCDICRGPPKAVSFSLSVCLALFVTICFCVLIVMSHVFAWIQLSQLSHHMLHAHDEGV